MSKILCIAEKFTLAEAAGKVLADMRGVRPEFEWVDAKKQQYNQVADVKFVWLDGHAFGQADPDHYLPDDVPKTASGRKRWRSEDLPIIPQHWKLLPKDQKAGRLSMIAAELKRCETVWHMGDPDEEGQVLVDECLDYFGYKGPTKRILINDYNPTPVKAALSNIRDNTEQMFRAWHFWGVGRARYDWLLGYNVTRAMTLRARALGYDGDPLAVGSVKTPLLYIVRERDRLIECFKPIPYFTLAAALKHANGSFRAKWKAGDDQPGLDAEGRLISASVAEKLADQLGGKPGTITAYSKTLKQQKAPLPLSMNELQMEGFSKFGYTSAQTLEAGQTLYEKYKVMSYPRSDVRYLSTAQHGTAPAVLDAVFKVRPDLAALSPALDVSRKSDAFNDKELEKTPHHGIVPAIPEAPVDPTTWTEIERNVYELVVRSYLAQFAAPYEYQQTSIEITIEGQLFAASGRTPAAQGWKAVYAESEEEADDEPDDTAAQSLPVMAEGDAITCERLDQTSRKTKAPARFDEKMLIECMMNVHKYVTDDAARKRLKEGDGIGTTATRSAIIEDLRYKKKDGQKTDEPFLLIPVKPGGTKLMTAPAARALIDALPFEVKDASQAGVFKGQLDAVANSGNPEQALAKFEAQTIEWITRLVQESKTLEMTLPPSTKAAGASTAAGDTTYPCVCGKGYMRLKTGPKGKFWGCSAYPECSHTLPDDKGKPGAKVSHSTVEHKCPECGKSLRQLTAKNGPNAGNKFWGCTGYADGCKYSADDKDGQPVAKPKAAPASAAHACPKCGKSMRLVPAKDARKAFWSCTGYPDCRSSADDVDGKPKFKEVKNAA